MPGETSSAHHRNSDEDDDDFDDNYDEDDVDFDDNEDDEDDDYDDNDDNDDDDDDDDDGATVSTVATVVRGKPALISIWRSCLAATRTCQSTNNARIDIMKRMAMIIIIAMNDDVGDRDCDNCCTEDNISNAQRPEV